MRDRPTETIAGTCKSYRSLMGAYGEPPTTRQVAIVTGARAASEGVERFYDVRRVDALPRTPDTASAPWTKLSTMTPGPYRHLFRRTVRMRGEGLPEERLGGSDAAILAQEEVDGAALLVDRSI